MDGHVQKEVEVCNQELYEIPTDLVKLKALGLCLLHLLDLSTFALRLGFQREAD